MVRLGRRPHVPLMRALSSSGIVLLAVVAAELLLYCRVISICALLAVRAQCYSVASRSDDALSVLFCCDAPTFLRHQLCASSLLVFASSLSTTTLRDAISCLVDALLFSQLLEHHPSPQVRACSPCMHSCALLQTHVLMRCLHCCSVWRVNTASVASCAHCPNWQCLLSTTRRSRSCCQSLLTPQQLAPPTRSHMPERAVSASSVRSLHAARQSLAPYAAVHSPLLLAAAFDLRFPVPRRDCGRIAGRPNFSACWSIWCVDP